jgi:DnaK suppressor protein
MSRKDSLLRLYQRLNARRDTLRDKLSLGSEPDRVDVGDLGDVAHDSATTELNSQLASIETRELRLVERAIQLLRDGRYGVCEGCTQPIPIARLQALPYTVLCVECQRVEEEVGPADPEDVDWDKACDYEVRFSEREVTIDDLRIE